MKKRSWTIASMVSDGGVPTPDWLKPVALVTSCRPNPQAGQSAALTTSEPSHNQSQKSPAPGSVAQRSTDSPTPEPKLDHSELITVTARKSKACPACRKQKIRCIMENDVPPCKSCAEKGRFCSPNKTLQTIVQDQAIWNKRIERHISRLEAAFNETRGQLSLPPRVFIDVGETADEDAKARDTEVSDEDLDAIDSDMAIPTADGLASAPIRSLYAVTMLRSLHEEENADIQSSGIVFQPDFISKGVINLAAAERLAKSYLTRLDHYFYGHLEKYPDFASIRKTSTVLALSVCTVAALHDPLGSDLYDKLSRELQSLVAKLIFRPRLGLEEIRSLCIGSYWLPDMTWMLSGLGIRKAISLQYPKAHLDQPNTDHTGFLHSQLWLFIYLCNEHVSILQGVPPTGVTRDFVKWQQHMASPFATDADLRCVSHIDLLLILSRARELYGLDMTKPIPQMLIPQLREFSTQVDRWAATWSHELPRNKCLGDFPSEAVRLQYHFAKFYLCSHAFRGLHTNEESGVSLSHELEDIAACAITTAFAVLDTLLESDELKAGLVGVPHYFHTMYAFVAVFLLKVSTRYTQHVNVDRQLVIQTIRKVVDVFASSPCARQHLVHRITRGLKEILDRCVAEHNAANGLSSSNGGNGGALYDESLKHDHDHAAGVANLTMSDSLEPLDQEIFDFWSSLPPSWLIDYSAM
ncbi:uncharacterized protein V1513DRAFT_445610 [Lipomyces chichibuensis]|uniref:uncharacterized protein n=1 Tax=Lipomyces chichibuensis TaxID=1546026 RepID=UPI0033441C38